MKQRNKRKGKNELKNEEFKKKHEENLKINT